MVRAETSQVDELAPEPAYQALSNSASAALVDVRTSAEWAHTGLPDLSGIDLPVWPIELVRLPDMSPNPDFVAELMEHAGGELPERLFFICKVGGRSMAAAQLVARQAQAMNQPVHCTNVAEGFEGNIHPAHADVPQNGWKARGLPWKALRGHETREGAQGAR